MRRGLITCALAVAAGAALAAATLSSPDAGARSEQGTAACSEPAREAPATLVPRPSLPQPRQLASGRVVVHYTSAAPNAPPAADTAPRNGVPDYVEKVRNAAEAALTFFARPDFNGESFPGFDTSFSDAGGPDAKLDIYVMNTGRAQGRTAPPTRGEGGAFVMVSNRLVDRPRSTRIRGNGIRFTVSHELFHVVQSNYVPAGMPLWIAEGTANTMAFFFEDADRFVQLDADLWLKRPQCALWYQGFNCERCYGGIWFWGTNRELLRLYFEHMAHQVRAGRPPTTGIAALESAFQALAPGESFVTPYFFLSFAFSFAPAQASAAYARGRGRLGFTTSIHARRTNATRRLTLNPLSVHYISVRMPRGTKALELKAVGIDQPDPLQTLLLGARPGPRRTLRVSRAVEPCVTSFLPLPGYGTFSDLIRVNVRSARERARSILVIANRTNRRVPYALTYRTLSARVADPSPSHAWGTPGGSGAGALCQKDASDVESAFDQDPIADAELGAPDLTRLDVSRLNVRGNSRRLLAFVIKIPNRRELTTDDQIVLSFDTDRNPNSGCPPFGSERDFLIGGAPGPDVYSLGRCVNGEMDFGGAAPRGTFQARYDETNRQLVVLATETDLDARSPFNFVVFSLWKDRASNEVRIDISPDGAIYCFPTPACGQGALQ